MDPHQKRERDERRLTGLKVGAVGLTVAGLGVFAGLAAAGTDSTPATPTSSATPGGSQAAQDAARAAEDGSFFDDRAQQGAVGDYQGYDDGGDGWGHHDDHGEYGAGGSYGGDSVSGSPPGGYAAPSQGSSGAS